MEVSDTSIHWFRKDLRLHDNIALLSAIRSCSTFIPLYIVEEDILDFSITGTNRLGFLLDSLLYLDKSLREKGSRLVIVRGEPAEIFKEFIKYFCISYLSMTEFVGPEMMNEEKAIVNTIKELGVKVETFSGHTLYDPAHLLSLNGGRTPFSMSEFLKIIARAGEPTVPYAAPGSIPALPAALKELKGEFLKEFKDVKVFKKVPTLEDLDEPEERTATIQAGEDAAIGKMEEYLSATDKVVDFDYTQTNPAQPTPTDTTVLSPYLANGNLSVRLFYHRINRIIQCLPSENPASTIGKSPVSLKGQLYWRELAHMVAYSTPRFNEMSANPYCVCMQMSWLGDKRAKGLADRWAQGMTGYPIVDACMRQLKRDGWMHYAARHLCVSFLTRGDIRTSWWMGRDIFQKYLLDADWCVNTFSWHWMSCNSFFQEQRRPYIDVPTYFKRFDPEGSFIREYVPELKMFPRKYIYEPWNLPEKDQEKCGCVIGADYPTPFGGSDGIHMYKGDHTHLIIDRQPKRRENTRRIKQGVDR